MSARANLMFVNDLRLGLHYNMVPAKDILPGTGSSEGMGIIVQKGTPFGTWRERFMSPLGVPCQALPFGTLSAVNLKTYKLVWQVPVGTVQDTGPLGLTVTVGADYDQSTDDRRGYQNFNGAQLGVKGEPRRDERDTATSLAPYIQAHWEVGKWTTDLGLRHSTMDMQVDDHYLANGDSSGSKKYQQNTPSLSVMYASRLICVGM